MKVSYCKHTIFNIYKHRASIPYPLQPQSYSQAYKPAHTARMLAWKQPFIYLILKHINPLTQ